MAESYEQIKLESGSHGERFPLTQSKLVKSPYSKPKLFCAIFLPFIVGFGAGVLLIWGLTLPMPSPSPNPTNLIFFIGDGFGPSAVTLTRVMLNGSLSFDDYLIGTVKTFASNTLVTDSAAAATAMACGIKTYNDAIAVNDQGVAIGTIMEAAIAEGLSAGIVVTSPVSHATPAGFSSHAIDRDLMDFIAFQQVQQGIDIILGGGLSNFQANNDLALNLATERGYNVIYNRNDLETVSLPVLGLFAPNDMTYMIDKEPSSIEPTLSEMVYHTLRLLTEQANPSGFILLIEGSRIDHAEHENDPVATYTEAIEFEKTYQLVIDFVKSNGNTLILATADHETGGISLGRDGIYAWNPDVLKQVTKSARFITNAIKTSPIESAITIFENYTTFILTQTEKDVIINSARNDSLLSVVSGIISKRSLIGWTTSAHSGVDVNLYGYGPNINNFYSNMDNTELANKILEIFNWDIEAITEKLKNFDTSGKNYTSGWTRK